MSTFGDEEAFARPESDHSPGSTGLTKREYFSAMAMQALIARDDLYTAETNDEAAIGAADNRPRRKRTVKIKGETK